MINENILDKYIKIYPTYKYAIKKRNAYNGNVIAITGSCGKTCTTTMVYEILYKKYNVKKSHENANGFLGIGYNINNIFNQNNKYWIQEIGIDHVDEMLPKITLIKPHIYILTNIYEAHTSNFSNISEYHQEKINFIYYALPNSIIIVNNDNEIIKKHLKENIEHYKLKNIKIILCGSNNENDIQLIEYKINEDNVSSTYHIKIKNFHDLIFTLNGIGRHYGENACLAIACGIECNIPVEIIKNSLNNFKFNTSRGIIKDINNLKIFDYSYNMIYKACCKNLKEFKNININSNQKIIIIGKFDIKDINSINDFNNIIDLSLSITNNVNIFTYYENTINEIKSQNKNKVKIFNKAELLVKYLNDLNKNKKWFVYIQTPHIMNTLIDVIYKL